MFTKRRRLILYLIIMISALFLLKKFVVQPFIIFGNSMYPTLNDGQLCLVNKLIYKIRDPLRKEIVVFRTTDDPPLYFVKRVVGLSEETISINKGYTHVNGEVIDEPYTVRNGEWNEPPVQVKKDQLFVIGDNRSADLPEHVHGIVARKNIIGRVENCR